MRDWTEQQRKAIKDASDSLLVSAAAGSGKTATLSERCAHLVCEQGLCKANELLVVTFTEEAAAEMKSRVEEAMRKRLAENPGDRRVKEQIALLPGAQISTIHAFCARLLKQHFQAVQLDPAFAVLDEQEAMLLQREIAGEMLEEYFDREDGVEREKSRFKQLVDYYADGRDVRIEDQVIATHNVLSSLTDPGAWCASALKRLREVADCEDLFKTSLGKEFLALIKRRLEGEIKRCDQIIEALKGNASAADCQVVVGRVQELLDMALEALPDKWEEAREALEGEIPGLQRMPACEERERAKELVAAAKKPLAKDGDLRQMLSRTKEQMREEIIRTIAPAECFLELVGEFSRRYEEAKQRENVVDFSDLEHLALKVLDDEAIARQCRKRFATIMVDEFQDVNALQWEILRRVSRCDENGRPTNLFCVGDVKQSIYRFRLADPSIFRKREEEWLPLDRVIYMGDNFRSRDPLLQAINFVFRELMRSESAEIEYTEEQELCGQRKFPPADNVYSGSPIELHLLYEDKPNGGDQGDGQNSDDDTPDGDEDDFTRVEREAQYVAQLISQMMAEGKLITEKSGVQRPIEYRDIAILLRSAKHTFVEYSRALVEKGIPVFAESRTGFFQAAEINEVLSILRLLDNQQQDIPMAAVLRGRILQVSDPETSMARIRIRYRHLPFQAAVVAYAESAADELAGELMQILEKLAAWRKRSLQMSVADLLWEILTSTGYLEFCRGMKAGEQRVANLMYLHRCARKFSGFRQQGLFRFLQYLEQLEDRSDLGQPSPGEPGNAVRVMTVHASKGLEFPVVILSGVGARFNDADEKGAILVHRDQGLAVAVADPENDIRYPSVPTWLAKDRIRKEARAEELRVLYVAMTRAQERLVLVGTCKQKQAKSWRALPSPGNSPVAFGSASNMLQWLLPLVDISSGKLELKVAKVEAEDEQASTVAAAEAPHADDDGPRIWNYSYPFREMTHRRASNSVTGLSKGDEVPTDTPDVTDEAPSGAAGEEARERGVAVHLFMEQFDFAAGAPGPADQLKSLVERGIMSQRQAELVDTSEVEWMLSEPSIAELLRSAQAIVREIPMLDSDPAGTAEFDRVLVRGRIDAVVQTPDGLVVIDYKTDRHFPEDGSQRQQAYRKQMELYRSAIERSGLGRVAGVKLVFLHARRVLEL